MYVPSPLLSSPHLSSPILSSLILLLYMLIHHHHRWCWPWLAICPPCKWPSPPPLSPPLPVSPSGPLPLPPGSLPSLLLLPTSTPSNILLQAQLTVSKRHEKEGRGEEKTEEGMRTKVRRRGKRRRRRRRTMNDEEEISPPSQSPCCPGTQRMSTTSVAPTRMLPPRVPPSAYTPFLQTLPPWVSLRERRGKKWEGRRGEGRGGNRAEGDLEVSFVKENKGYH